MSRVRLGLWLTTLIWIAVAGGMWAVHEYQLENGEEIALKTVPVDPRDLLRGDYVTLRYEISTAEKDAEKGAPWTFRSNQVVFVALEGVDGDWSVRDVLRVAPAEGLYLRGRLRSARPDRLEIEYGIESFFVPEGEGRDYEEARNRDRLWAVVSVSPHGVARLKRLEIR